MKSKSVFRLVRTGSPAACILAGSIAALLVAPATQAAISIKQDNTDNLSLATSWDFLPGIADVAQWDFTVTGANSTVAGADLSWSGIRIVDPGGPVTIGAGNTLTIGASGIDLSAATQDLTLNCGLRLQGRQSWKAAAGRTLDVAGTFTRSGAAVDFTGFDAAAILGTLANDVTGILGPWATTGSGTALQYVASTAGSLAAYGGATPDAGDLASVTDPAANYTYAAAATLGGSQTGHTLQYTGGATTTDLGTNGLTLNGLMNAGTGKLTITGTAENPGVVIGSSGELDIITNTQPIDIKSVISGTGTVMYSGAAAGTTLALYGTNTFDGGLTVTSGTLSVNGPLVAGSNAVLGSGTLTMLPGTTLAPNRSTLPNSMILTDCRVSSGNSFGSAFSGPITVVGVVNLLDTTGTGNIVYSGDISGTGGVLGKGSREDNQVGVALSGTNTFAGPATVGPNATMRFVTRESLPNTGGWTTDNLVVSSGGTAFFNVGGTSPFTAADIDSLVALGSDTGGFLNGSFIGLDNSANLSYNDVTNVIADTNGGANKLGLKKWGGSTLTLGDNNTYTGPTYLHAGTLEVSSLNSVVGGTASSSLGAPTTVADGTIVLNPYTPTPTLKYSGAGETTDRMISAKGSNLIIDQSGSGLLKFTGDIAGTNNTATFTLQGSTAGEGEFAGTVGGNKEAKIVKNGTGTWTLSGANFYTGTTTLTAGVLSVASISNSGLTPTLTTTANNAVVTASSTAGLVVGQTVNSGKIPAGATIASIEDDTHFTLASGTGVTAGTTQASVIGTPGNLGFGTANLIFNGGTLRYTGATATTNRNFVINAGKTATIDVTTSNLTLSGSSTATTGALAKTGPGTLTLSGANLYSGATTVGEGTLALGASNVLADTTAVSIGNGTLDAATYTDTLGTLDVTDTATIKLATGATLAFANSAAIDWSGGSLNLTGTFVSGASLRFGIDNTGLTGDQLALISGTGLSSFALNAEGYLTATGGASDYDTWAGPSGYNLTGGPNDDDDGDGLSNHKEYAFGLNPTSGASASPISQQLDKTTGMFKYTRRATPATTGLTYTYESSGTLGNDWAVFTPDSEVSNNATPVEEITVDVPDALLLNAKLFLRVKAAP
jgi:autotransporter-associated beta strand protein